MTKVLITTFTQRVLRAALLDGRVYEEVEGDARGTGQAVGIVLLAGIAGGLGLLDLASPNPRFLVAGIIGSVVGWMAWATLTHLIGTRLLPEPQTQADIGQLLRTTAFASAPGVLRVLAVVPVVGAAVYVLASLWMLLAMVVAVRHALDYRSNSRAVAVCAVSWVLSLIVAVMIANLFAPTVS